MNQNIRSNFDMLRAYEEQLWRLADLSRRHLIAPERKRPGARWRLVPEN
jgi:hypothetical protein